jgi:hypothetical protein
MAARTRAAWWLVGGSERCVICRHRHVLEMEIRCNGCDRGICTHCVIFVHETGERLCSDCHEGERED